MFVFLNHFIIRELKLAEQAKKVEEERLEKMMQEEEERLEHLQYIEQVVMKEKVSLVPVTAPIKPVSA